MATQSGTTERRAVMAMIDRYMEEQSMEMEIDELKSTISRLREELTSSRDTAFKYSDKVKFLERENTMLMNEQHRLLREISQLKWEMNNVIVSVPPSEQERFIAQMAVQLKQAEQATQNIVDDLKKQILSHMEIMPENKRYEFLVTCSSIFGNVSVINQIVPDLKKYLKESNEREKGGGNVRIDINGGNSSIYPNASNVNNHQ